MLIVCEAVERTILTVLGPRNGKLERKPPHLSGGFLFYQYFLGGGALGPIDENMGVVVLEALTDWPENSERLKMADGKR